MVGTASRRSIPRLLQALALGGALASCAPMAHAMTGPDRQTAQAGASASSAPRSPQQANQAMPVPLGEGRLQAVTASAGLNDAVGDNSLAPDLQTMTALTSDDGRYTVGIRLESNALIAGDFVTSYVNTDGNPGTGVAVFGGADVAINIVGAFGTDSVASLRWNGAGWEPLPLSTLVSFPSDLTDEVWSVAASELGIGPGAVTTLAFATQYMGTYNDYFDFAPDAGGAPLGFVAGALALPVAPVATAPAPAAGSVQPAPAPAVSVAALSPGTPLAIRSFSPIATPEGIKLRLRWLGGEGPVDWVATLRTTIDGRRTTKTVAGRGRAGARTVLRSVSLPRDWRGTTVTIGLRTSDDLRTLTRVRIVRLPGPAPTPLPVRVARHVPSYSTGYNCDDFPLADGTSAQQYLGLYPGDPSGLDGDDDGQACEG